MKRCVGLLVVCALAVFGQRNKPFKTACGTLPEPLASIQQAGLKVDKSCGLKGGSTDTAKQLESMAKNDFCAKGAATEITTDALLKLQEASDKVSSLREDLKTSRDSLHEMADWKGAKLGEGKLVRMVAYLVEAHVSNKSKGEAVNCNIPGEKTNDFHIVLSATPDEEDECQSFTAEMSPHFRPEEWETLTRLSLGNRPIRVTGPLFFDGSHRPCTQDKVSSPKRASVWEIHPVYAFDICRYRTKGRCQADNAAVWIPLHKYQADEDDGPNR